MTQATASTDDAIREVAADVDRTVRETDQEGRRRNVGFSIMHVSGEEEDDPSLSALTSLVDELVLAEAEHPDIAVSDESGWTLSAFRSGRVVWEHVEADVEPRHLEHMPREQLITMLEALAEQDIEFVEAHPWRPGY